MNTAKVTVKGQVTNPKAARMALGIQEGGSVFFPVSISIEPKSLRDNGLSTEERKIGMRN